MDRISALNYQTIGGHRTFLDKNPGGGVPFGTTWSSIWAAGVQESIIGPVEGVGLVPADSVLGSPDTQLMQAIMLLAAAALHATVTATPGSPLAITDAGLIPVDATAGAITITLPAVAAANGKRLKYRFIRVDASVNTVTIAFHAGDTQLIGGATSFPLAGQGAVAEVAGDGVSHWVLELPMSVGTNIQVFSASGTFTVPVGAGSVDVEVWGGGGGSGGSQISGVGSGGGAGGYSRRRINGLVPGAAITVTVGAGGTAGASNGNGGAGGTSSFGAYLSATGGGPGLTNSVLSTAGGVGVGGDETITGGIGAGGVVFSSSIYTAGSGGGAPKGAPGYPGGTTSGSSFFNGVAGIVPGGGASAGASALGASTAPTGAGGGAGRVIVRW